MTKRHLRFAKLIYSTLDQSSFMMDAETFSYYVKSYPQFEQAGWEGIGQQFGDIFRLRRYIKKALELGVRPGPGVLQGAMMLAGELSLGQVLFGKDHVEPPRVTHHVGRTLH